MLVVEYRVKRSVTKEVEFENEEDRDRHEEDNETDQARTESDDETSRSGVVFAVVPCVGRRRRRGVVGHRREAIGVRRGGVRA